MNRFSCSFIALAAAIVLAGSCREARAADPVTVLISVTFPKGPTLNAYAQGPQLTGAGKLSNYVLKVTGGSIKGRYVSLAGVIVAGGGQTAPFQIDAEVTTGAVRFTYRGANGAMYSYTGKGSVSVK